MTYDTLFSPILINKLQLENRVVMAPTHDNMATKDGFVTPLMIEAYMKRARGGLGMINIGGCRVNPRPMAFVTQIHDDKYVPGLQELYNRIHSETGVKVGIQLTDNLKIGRRWHQPVDEVTREYIPEIIDNFESGAIRAREAGFDAIELHAAHGYTLAAFLSLRNKRTDEYGGSMEGRLKLVLEVYNRLRKALGPEFPIGIRINGDEFIVEGNTLQQSRLIAQKLAGAGFDYISVSAGGKLEDSTGVFPGYEVPANYPPYSGYSGFRAMPPAWMPEAVNVYLAADIRKAVRQAGYATPIITAGRIPHPKLAESILREEKADIIALSRPLLRDPDWPNKARQGREKEINRCTYCNQCIEREARGEPGLCQYLNE